MPRKPVKKSKRIANKRKKGFSWKLLKKNKSLKKKIYKIFSAFVLLLVASAFLGFLSIKKTLSKTFVSADSNTSFDIMSEEHATLAIITVDDIDADPVKISGLDVILFDKDKKKVVTFEIPTTHSIDVSGRYGDEEISKLISLGMLDSDDVLDGADFVKRNLEVKFAHSIDRYLILENDISNSVLDSFKTGKSSGLLNSEVISNLLLNSLTDLRVREFYDLYTFVNGLPSDRFISHLLSEDTLSDSNYIDAVIRDISFDSKVSLEQSSVAVLNGTNISGTATYGSRVLENLGAHVISVANAKETYHESILVVSDPNLAVVKEIQRFFKINKVLSKSEFTGNEGVADRADVTLIIGFDIANAL